MRIWGRWSAASGAKCVLGPKHERQPRGQRLGRERAGPQQGSSFGCGGSPYHFPTAWVAYPALRRRSASVVSFSGRAEEEESMSAVWIPWWWT